MKKYYSKSYIEERKIEPANALIVFLLGLASGLFILGAAGSFGLSGVIEQNLLLIVGVVYFIAVIAFLYPRKKRTHLHTPEPEIIEREKIIEKPIIKEVLRYKDRPVDRIVEKPVTKREIVEVEKIEPKKSKYVGSTYNEKYHLRTCRFSGAIKPKYLVEENDKEYFRLRGFHPCKVCYPQKN